MKKTALSVALFTTAVGVPQAAASEPFCYMETGDNQVINLNTLCGSTPVVAASSRSVSAPEVIQQQTSRIASTERWQHSAKHAAAMQPHWSGHCRIGNRPCHSLNTRRDFRAIHATISGGAIMYSSRGGCTSPNDRAVDGTRCGRRSSQSRPGGK